MLTMSTCNSSLESHPPIKPIECFHGPRPLSGFISDVPRPPLALIVVTVVSTHDMTTLLLYVEPAYAWLCAWVFTGLSVLYGAATLILA